jgi:hypothetical protein
MPDYKIEAVLDMGTIETATDILCRTHRKLKLALPHIDSTVHNEIYAEINKELTAIDSILMVLDNADLVVE